MPKRKLTALQKFRKATVRSFVRDKIKTREDKKRAEKKRLDTDTVEKWRALRRVGIYETKETPAVSRLTAARRRAIDQKFEKLQSIGTYDNGNVYRPLHRHEYQTTKTKFDEYGRAVKVTKAKKVRYELDREHFAVLNKKAKKLPPGSIPTPKGALVAKAPNEKVSITKDGRVRTVQTVGSARTQFTREPLSGPAEFIALVEDIRAGRLKFSDKEGLTLYNNGKKTHTYYGAAIVRLVERLERYINERNKGMRNFDDWASNSEIAKVKRL